VTVARPLGQRSQPMFFVKKENPTDTITSGTNRACDAHKQL
jgi:hypothetical protein